MPTKVTFPIGIVGAKGLSEEKETGEQELNSQGFTFRHRNASNKPLSLKRRLHP